MRLSINEEIHTLNQEDLILALRKVLIRFYKQKLKTLARNSTLSAQQKMFLIRKLRTDIIPRLEKGELVTYDLNF